MLDQALGLLAHHLGDLDVARGRLVEGRAYNLTLDRARHVGDLLGPLVDQQHDEDHLGVVGDDAVGDVLHQHRLAGARLRDDQRALALAERRNQVDHPAAHVLDRRVLDLELELFGRVVGRQVVEVDPMPRSFRRIEVDRVDLEQREVALALLGRPDLAVDDVAGAQPEAADLAGRDVDVVGSGKVVDVRRAQKAEAILQDLEDTLAVDRHAGFGQPLQGGEHEIGFAKRARVFDPELLGILQQFCRRAPFELGQIHEAGGRAGFGLGQCRGWLLEHFSLVRLDELPLRHAFGPAVGPAPAGVRIDKGGIVTARRV